MARLFVFSINYAPELTGFAPHSTAMAEHLARRGHEVVVLTGFAFAPHWRRSDGRRGVLAATERSEGLTVRRLAHFIPRRPSSALQRGLMEATFSVAALVAIAPSLLSRRRPEAVVYVGAQPLIAMLARVTAMLAGCTYFVNINDLAVQAAFDVGILRRAWIGRLLERFEFMAYRGAAAATVLCGSFEDFLVARGFPRERIHLLRSPIDLDVFRPIPRTPHFRVRYEIPENAFVLLWAGSMGKKQDLHSLLLGAELTRGSKMIWVLVGDGEGKPRVVDAVRERGLADIVRLVPMQPHSALAEIFAAADVLLLNQMRAVKDTVIPSKLLTYMAAGSPVLAAVNERSQGAEILRQSGGGLLVAAEDPAALAKGAEQMFALPEQTRKEWGQLNRAYAELNFDQRRILAAHEELILAGILHSRNRTVRPAASHTS